MPSPPPTVGQVAPGLYLERSFRGERPAQHANGADLLVLADDVSGENRAATNSLPTARRRRCMSE